MRPFSLGVITLVQGLFTAMALIVLVDVASPTFDVRAFGEWTTTRALVAVVVLLHLHVACA